MIGPKLASGLESLSHRRDVASLSLFYRYYNGLCSSELSDLVPPRKIFGRSTRLAANLFYFIEEVSSLELQFFGILCLHTVSQIMLI